jgi:hypothetical protein
VSFQQVYPKQVRVHEIALDVECLCGRNNYIETIPLIMFTCDCGRKYRIDLSVSVDDGDTERVRTGAEYDALCGACVCGAAHTNATHLNMINDTITGEPC